MSDDLSTRLVRLGERLPESAVPPESLPVVPSTVYAFADLDQLEAVYTGTAPGYIYARNGNPNHDTVAALAAGIDGAAGARVYASGMAAITLAMLAHVSAGDHVIVNLPVYGGTYQFFRAELPRRGVSVTYMYDTTNEMLLDGAFEPNTRFLFVETITNPLMAVPDIPRLAAIAHRHDARLIVDNTFATPVVCRPLALGADTAVYSATKYLGGHSDLMAGVVAADADTIARVHDLGILYGPTLGAGDAWLLARSYRTLDLRVRRQCANALALAMCLSRHPSVCQVHYPGLPADPSHARARAQFTDGLFGGMLSFELDGGEAVNAFIRALAHVRLAPSLGGCATTLSYPWGTSHRALSETERKVQGITPGLVRVSAGLESAEDLVGEFTAALDKLS